ncbi:hypothetical protein SAMN05421824_0406 [Hyunsoonleella jejuensis]|uniref:O-Antigen ligase n=1 Tax=Hyunsoonleella jejuensis TaxID=419940 RepID=A0A1H9AZA7_9FLAO|nr:hypothetical protein [Hyunsoonleella jejuensis]SEP82122.1 hypothetical protein SAMN05421824_0406 [Hyunsoonleella jejuensis]
MKIKLGYLILLLQLVIVFLSEFLSRYIAFFSQATQLTFSIIFIALLIYIYKRKVKPKMVWIILLSLTIIVLGVFRNQFFINIFQLILVCSNFIFVFYMDKLDEQICKSLIKLIIIFCVSQLFFDLFFPKDSIDPLDRYSGTFVMANNKSRFLFFLLPYLFFLGKKNFYYGIIGKFFTISVIIFSAYLGFSNLGVLILLMSFVLGYIVKNIYKLSAIMFVIIYVIYTISFMAYEKRRPGTEYTAIQMNYERFFDTEIGVSAVYKYGYEQLKETYFLGVGYGNFTSRSGQIFDSEITENIPKQMIKKWQPLFENKSPYGLSSLFVLIVELGFFSMIPIFILLRWLHSIIKKAPFYLRVMVIYLFFIINYNPTFFEFNESILYLLTLIVVNKLNSFNEQKNIHSTS